VGDSGLAIFGHLGAAQGNRMVNTKERIAGLVYPGRDDELEVLP
jgi:hypothetical protein